MSMSDSHKAVVSMSDSHKAVVSVSESHKAVVLIAGSRGGGWWCLSVLAAS